jgi:purine-binding chemotaxis protein CheW
MNQITSQSGQNHAGGMRELISFRIGAQEFCVDIMAIREIRGWTAATALPQSPSFVKGVINLRGAVLPIVDLASRLGFESTEASDRNVIIVAQIGEQVVGLLVDAVSDILTVTSDQIRPVPELDDHQERDFLDGLIAIDSRMVTLISLDGLFHADDAAAGRASLN